MCLIFVFIIFDLGEWLFKCEQCGCEFNYRSYFNNYFRIYIGEKFFKCEICDKDFFCKVFFCYYMKVYNKGDGQVRICSKKDEQFDIEIMDE